MKPLKHWQDLVNAALGVWVVLAPWALGFDADLAATSNSVLVGIALIAAAMGAMLVPHAWEELTEMAIGVWLIVSPWVLGFSMLHQAMLVSVMTGAAVVLLALWTLMFGSDYRSWLSDEPASH